MTDTQLYSYRDKGDTGTTAVSGGDDYTQEAVSNAAGTEQTQDFGVEQNAVNYDTAYYDPSHNQNTFYYQDAEGNYYQYLDPPVENDPEVFGNAVEMDPNQSNAARFYMSEDWEPQSFGRFADIVVDTFFSKLFRVYLTILLYCTGALVAALGLNYTFAVLFRLFSPPDPVHNKDLQALCYLSMFFYISFVFCSAFCALIDMTKNLWWQHRDEPIFWGMSHRSFSKQKPPYMVYFVIITVTLFLPILWGILETAARKQSVVFIAQRYANVAVLVSTFLLLFCYIWFYWRALVYKRSAIKKYKLRDDFRLRRKAYKHRPEKMLKVHWYHAACILEEFGVDGKTLRYNTIVFTVGCVPILGMYAGKTLSTLTGDPSALWGAISSIGISCIYVIAWLSMLSRKAQWSVYASFVMIVVLFVLGLVGGSGTPVLIGVVAVLFVVCQGMCTRKRKHTMTRREVCEASQIPYTTEIETAEHKRYIDTYLFCCRNVILDFFKCFDIRELIEHKHPDIVMAERRYAIRRIALRTDQKVLFAWWMVVLTAVAVVLGLSNTLSYTFTSTVALASTQPSTGTDPSPQICSLVYNALGKAPLNMLDLALLSALSYTFGTDGDKDFTTWFSHMPTLVRQYPIQLPPTLNYATDGITVRFSDYVDTSTDFHFITLNSNYRGVSVFRDLDDWGESLTLQVAGVISPLTGMWPEEYRKTFVQGIGFLKNWFPPSTALDEVSQYIEKLSGEGTLKNTVLVGDQFNGGYAKMLSAKYGVEFVAFNPPGTTYRNATVASGTQMVAARSLWSYIDSVDDTTTTFFTSCDAKYSSHRCGRITTTIDYLVSTCGDRYGRSIV